MVSLCSIYIDVFQYYALKITKLKNILTNNVGIIIKMLHIGVILGILQVIKFLWSYTFLNLVILELVLVLINTKTPNCNCFCKLLSVVYHFLYKIEIACFEMYIYKDVGHSLTSYLWKLSI